MQLVSRVRQTFSIELPLRTVFEESTLGRLAQRVEATSTHTKTAPLTACSRSEKLPLSFAQERMWFINQMDQDSSAYHISMALHLIGALDVQALEQSLSEIIRRHEVLRTTFMNQGGQPVQIIAENAEFVLPVIDLTVRGGLPDKAEVRKLAKKEAQRSFDLSRDLLLRASLVRLGAEDYGHGDESGVSQ